MFWAWLYRQNCVQRKNISQFQTALSAAWPVILSRGVLRLSQYLSTLQEAAFCSANTRNHIWIKKNIKSEGRYSLKAYVVKEVTSAVKVAFCSRIMFYCTSHFTTDWQNVYSGQLPKTSYSLVTKCQWQGLLSEQLTDHLSLTDAYLIFRVFVTDFDEKMADFRLLRRVMVTYSDVSE